MSAAEGRREAGALRVLVLADDLIWATRLVGQLRTLGADPVRVGTAEAFAAAVAGRLPAAMAGRLPAGARPMPAGPAHVPPVSVPPASAGQAEALAEPAAAHAVVDLTARAYDGLAAVRLASGAGMRVLCVGQHDDHELRRAARAAGADRVFAYRKLFEDGHATLAAWLGLPAPAAGSLPIPPNPEVPAR